MPKHKKGNNNRRYTPKHMPFQTSDEDLGQLYGTVSAVLGNCQFKVTSLTGDIKTASIAGKIKNNNIRIRMDDFVLIEPLGETFDSKYQIIFRYTPDQKKTLEREGQLNIIDVQETVQNPVENSVQFEHEVINEDMLQQEEDMVNDLIDNI
jgi:initiation factor 1A